jgi:hypothetical protein
MEIEVHGTAGQVNSEWPLVPVLVYMARSFRRLLVDGGIYEMPWIAGCLRHFFFHKSSFQPEQKGMEMKSTLRAAAMLAATETSLAAQQHFPTNENLRNLRTISCPQHLPDLKHVVRNTPGHCCERAAELTCDCPGLMVACIASLPSTSVSLRPTSATTL